VSHNPRVQHWPCALGGFSALLAAPAARAGRGPRLAPSARRPGVPAQSDPAHVVEAPLCGNTAWQLYCCSLYSVYVD
jgi:hypothetical protein